MVRKAAPNQDDTNTTNVPVTPDSIQEGPPEVLYTPPKDRGTPVEHYRGEPQRHDPINDPGDLEQEVLDPGAPYNKTYGVRSNESVEG